MAWSLGVAIAALLFGSFGDARPLVDVQVERDAAAGDCPAIAWPGPP
jgi:hypothetical protein